MAYTIGIDYGSNSVRAIVVDCSDGKEIGTCVYNYPTGHQGIILDEKDHNLARQNPADYIAGLEVTIVEAIKEAAGHDGFSPEKVIGIGVDTTGSTPIPVNKDNIPLALDAMWKDNPAAHAWLWKDHTGYQEADKITELAKEHRPQYLAKCGDTYSSEWFWSKLWRCLNAAPAVFDAAYSWVELADFIPAVLVGETDPVQIKRGVCAAGHKAMYCNEWNGLPDKEFLAMLDAKLADLRDRLYEKAYDGDTAAGTLCNLWAKKLGLQEGIAIAIGAFDAHYGAIGAGVEEGTLVKIIGTSACDCSVAPTTKKVKDIPGICGIVDGSILPGHYGIEAGQSAVGDIFKWFVEVVCQNDGSLHQQFTDEADRLKPGQAGLLALDWNNGNRTILVDPLLSGLLLGQTLHSAPAEIYRALIEATAFGARAIIERMSDYDVSIDRIICCGGIAEKNPMLMQIYADVTGCTMLISGSSQTCALGAAIGAAVIAGKDAGGYATFADAQSEMVSVKSHQYIPKADNKSVYDKIYLLYRQVHDAFGGVTTAADLSGVMKELIAIKKETNN